MNKELRQKLIERAKKKRTISYSEAARIIGINDLSDQSARNILSRELGAISEFEHNEGRPLLSAVAIYSSNDASRTSLTDIHGGGFYAIAEMLEIGSKSKLEKEGYGILAMNESFEYWSNPKNHDNEVLPEDQKDIPQFFIAEDISLLESASLTGTYDESNDSHQRLARYITVSIAPKVKYWAEQVAGRMKGFTFNFKNNWIQPNGPGKSKFKPYSWARIYRIGQESRLIFFTVGINGDEERLDFKLDFKFSSDTLTKNQKDLLRNNIPSHLRMIEIKTKELADYNWESLIDKTYNLFSTSIDHYDSLVKLAWEVDKQSSSKHTDLVRFPSPNAEDFSELADDDFTPKNTDYIQDAKNKKEIGDCGEKIVLKFEQESLEEFPDLKDQVKKMQDGEGYDIFSKHPDGRDKYIEVKSTTGSNKRAFFLSRREVNFAKKYPKNYIIYRLYDLNIKNDSAKFFTIDNAINNLSLQPTEYRATPKK